MLAEPWGSAEPRLKITVVECQTCDQKVAGSTPSQVKCDGLWASKPSWYITNTMVNSACHPSGVGKLSMCSACLAKVMARCMHLCREADDTVKFHMAGDASQLCGGFPMKSYII